MVQQLLARSRLLALPTIAVLALFLLIAVAPGHPVVHAQRAASAAQAAANASTVAISVTIGANTGQTFEASHVALGGQSAAQPGTGTGGLGPFTGNPIIVDRLVDPLSPVLWTDLATGKLLDLVTIDFTATNASGRATPFETVKLQNVRVTALQDVAQAQGAAETITLLYERITITSFDADGNIITQFTYDVQQGTSS
ncbi:MAG TPA: type VI secretion system tube protein Hcp [Ktedonobacteraceae bacterium]|nr:type VI secretion system tube protein Hcp [Ktedonobacteraceae bacterium]